MVKITSVIQRERNNRLVQTYLNTKKYFFFLPLFAPKQIYSNIFIFYFFINNIAVLSSSWKNLLSNLIIITVWYLHTVHGGYYCALGKGERIASHMTTSMQYITVWNSSSPIYRARPDVRNNRIFFLTLSFFFFIYVLDPSLSCLYDTVRCVPYTPNGYTSVVHTKLHATYRKMHRHTVREINDICRPVKRKGARQ